MKFRNEAYSDLVSDLILDAFYIDRPNRGKIASIRQFAEVVIRKILDLSENDKVTLGEKTIVNKLKEVLNTKFGVFRNVQNIRSHESIMMQLSDFMMGAISYLHNNEEKKNSAKRQIIDKIQQHCNENLQQTNYSNKFNLFFIELQ